jgi:CubicO group peptidase (beta-lactamase class C family)
MSSLQFRFALALVKIVILVACVLLAPRTAAADDAAASATTSESISADAVVGRIPTNAAQSAATSDTDHTAPAAADAAQRIEGTVRRLDGVELAPERVAAIVERLIAAGKVTGIGVAVINDNALVYRRAFGYANVDTKRALAEDTVMYAASFTKAMFAFLVMQLVDDGVIDLDTPIERYLPKPLPSYEDYADLAGDERWRAITPRMLLAHTAGFSNWRFIDADGNFDEAGKLELRRAPGTRYGYSGEGITLLQFVLEEGLGLDVEALMQTRVFDRFDMTRTAMRWRDDFLPNLANGYDEAGANLGHNKRESVRAAGSADSDLIGMSRFLQAMLQGAARGDAGIKDMWSPQVRITGQHQFPVSASEIDSDRDDGIQLSYGLGWGVMTTPYGRAAFKAGHIEGWENYMIAYPGTGTGLVIMTNSSNGESIFKALLAELIADRWTPWEWNRYTPYDAAEAKE